ncbi:hypothetical protein F5Y16DRAFT_184140 [Xylariaceae sp. FL0255]|nr:hypothetical protein F5Y16DRAFT_184140 [Xylariaceae sp. FL0255]
MSYLPLPLSIPGRLTLYPHMMKSALRCRRRHHHHVTINAAVGAEPVGCVALGFIGGSRHRYGQRDLLGLLGIMRWRSTRLIIGRISGVSLITILCCGEDRPISTGPGPCCWLAILSYSVVVALHDVRCDDAHFTHLNGGRIEPSRVDGMARNGPQRPNSVMVDSCYLLYRQAVFLFLPVFYIPLPCAE